MSIKSVLKKITEAATKSKTFKVTADLMKDEKFKGNKSQLGKWKEIDFKFEGKEKKNVAFTVDELKDLAVNCLTIPEGFKLHARLQKYFINERLASLNQGVVDWAFAEMIAFAGLIKKGYNFRLSGQDVGRGTFSQRHLLMVDQETNKEHFILPKSPGRFTINNSVLAEQSVVSYEYGYSLENPSNYVIWEAQFGDFANCAQVAFDQFVATGEKKWLRQSGLVMLLPHGFDNAGPEHSSSRIERFLQAVEAPGLDENYRGEPVTHKDISVSICNLTSAANYYHCLLRQVNRTFRMPLVIFSPKIGLKSKEYMSQLKDLADGQFMPILPSVSKENTKVVLCSGQIFVDVEKARAGSSSLGLVRIEELAPFPENQLLKALEVVGKDTRIIWLQEEPTNMGAFFYVQPHIRRIMKKLGMKNELELISRPAQIAAHGCSKTSKKEKDVLIQDISSLLI